MNLSMPSQYVKCLCCGDVTISEPTKERVTGCRVTGCPGEVRRLSEWDVILALSNAPIGDLLRR